jgi:hypothetical protein
MEVSWDLLTCIGIGRGGGLLDLESFLLLTARVAASFLGEFDGYTASSRRLCRVCETCIDRVLVSDDTDIGPR